MAIWAVSGSRISPTMILSGSWRRIERGAAGKGEAPLLLVDRNLGDASQLVLDRIFDGDDLVFGSTLISESAA